MTREELNEDKQKEIFKEENKKKTKIIVKKVFKIFIIFMILFYSFNLYTTYISEGSYIVKEKRIVNNKIPTSFYGTKIIHFSDLHYGSNITLKETKKIVKLINSRNPDLVFFTGDLIDKDYKLDSKEQEKIIKELKKINASLGKYAVIGDEDSDNFSTILNQSDFVVLNNEYELIYNNTNDAILLSGFSTNIDVNKALDYFNIDTSNSNIYSIGLIHIPDNTDDILDVHGMDLLLAGHSHNGDIKIPYIGPIIKKDGAKKYNDEYYKVNNTLLYISSGIGTKNNSVRLFCRPSINFFRLSNS